MKYSKPTIVDYGSLRDVTEALAINGPEDGASKLVILHHSAPAGP
jgi:hypothetical protein